MPTKGQRKTVDGVEYQLNSNSRWERVLDSSGAKSKLDQGIGLSNPSDDFPDDHDTAVSQSQLEGIDTMLTTLDIDDNKFIKLIDTGGGGEIDSDDFKEYYEESGYDDMAMVIVACNTSDGLVNNANKRALGLSYDHDIPQGWEMKEDGIHIPVEKVVEYGCAVNDNKGYDFKAYIALENIRQAHRDLDAHDEGYYNSEKGEPYSISDEHLKNVEYDAFSSAIDHIAIKERAMAMADSDIEDEEFERGQLLQGDEREIFEENRLNDYYEQYFNTNNLVEIMKDMKSGSPEKFEYDEKANRYSVDHSTTLRIIDRALTNYQ